MYSIFIDGKEGTTGLRIYERLADRQDIRVISLSDADRKNVTKRAEALNNCDLAFLCLPDDAARESVSLVQNPDVRIIDCSTAHRTAPGWVYGFPELSAATREILPIAKRVANPGCHASGFIALIYPLVCAGILDKNTELSCCSLTGYSGGGKKMIAQYESADREDLLNAPRHYGLSQQHKHLPEMQGICGLSSAPVFCPIVADFYCGMLVSVPLFAKDLTNGHSIESIRSVYAEYYNGPIVNYVADSDESGFLSAQKLAGYDTMEITVCGNEDRMVLMSRFDNLGKGASGSALQCMNIMLGMDQTLGLKL